MPNEEPVDKMLSAVDKAEADNDFIFKPEYARWAVQYLIDQKVWFDVMHIVHLGVTLWIFHINSVVKSPIYEMELPGPYVQNHEHLAIIQAQSYARHMADGGHAQEEQIKKEEHE